MKKENMWCRANVAITLIFAYATGFSAEPAQFGGTPNINVAALEEYRAMTEDDLRALILNPVLLDKVMECNGLSAFIKVRIERKIEDKQPEAAAASLWESCERWRQRLHKIAASPLTESYVMTKFINTKGLADIVWPRASAEQKDPDTMLEASLTEIVANRTVEENFSISGVVAWAICQEFFSGKRFLDDSFKVGAHTIYALSEEACMAWIAKLDAEYPNIEANDFQPAPRMPADDIDSFGPTAGPTVHPAADHVQLKILRDRLILRIDNLRYPYAPWNRLSAVVKAVDILLHAPLPQGTLPEDGVAMSMESIARDELANRALWKNQSWRPQQAAEFLALANPAKSADAIVAFAIFQPGSVKVSTLESCGYSIVPPLVHLYAKGSADVAFVADTVNRILGSRSAGTIIAALTADSGEIPLSLEQREKLLNELERVGRDR